jgi:hypothetical protein|tara:strand:- start:468 stop:1070 length:603 start_codon:yes stop_codon:yes gene_type:complete
MSNIYSLVDDEQWKPVWGFPGYEISSYGRCVSHWKMRGGKDSGGNYIDESYTRFIGTPESKNTSKKRGYIKTTLRRPYGLEESHPLSHYNKLSEGKPDWVGMVRVTMVVHKLVMWHFNYLDDNPEQIGITIDEWESMPERAKEIIRQSLEINHIDHDVTNNKLSNLEYVTKVENSQAYRDSDKFQEYMQGVSKTDSFLLT